MNSNEKTFLEKIHAQSKGIAHDQVFVIEIENISINELSFNIKKELEKFNCLQMLTIANCSLESLNNLPNIRSLITLNVSSNKISGNELGKIGVYRYLQNLNISCNSIRTLSDLNPLKNLGNLLNLDLLYNPVSSLANYRSDVLGMFPKITILDGVNRTGQNFNIISTMDQCASRVRNDLFEKTNTTTNNGGGLFSSLPLNNGGLFGNTNSNGLFGSNNANGGALFATPLIANNQTTNSIFSFNNSQSNGPSIFPMKSNSPSNFPITSNGPSIFPIKNKAISKKKNVKNASPIVIPISKIKRALKETTNGLKIKKESTIYLTSVLETIMAEILHISCLETKSHNRVRIQPRDIINAMKDDIEMEYLLKSKFFESLEEETSTKPKQRASKRKNVILSKLRKRTITK